MSKKKKGFVMDDELQVPDDEIVDVGDDEAQAMGLGDIENPKWITRGLEDGE